MHVNAVTAAIVAAAVAGPVSCRGILTASQGQASCHFSNTTSSFPTTSLYETVYASEVAAPHKNTTANTSCHGLRTTNRGDLLVQTQAQEDTAGRDVYTMYQSSISEDCNEASTRVDGAMGYIGQVHNALESLVNMLVPEHTMHSDMTTVNATRNSPSDNSSTAFHTPTMNLTLPTPVPVGHPTQRDTQFDLIFLNATSPCYIALGHTNNSFIMIWQAPISNQPTPTDTKALNDAKEAKTWSTVFYYWAKVVFFITGGVCALRKAIKTIIDMRA